METKEFFKSEFICWDDVSHLGDVERIATILDEGRYKPSQYSESKMNFVLVIQLAKSMEIFDFRMQKKSWRNLKDEWGSDSKDWLGKQVSINPFVYKEGHNGIELKPVLTLSQETVKETDSKQLDDAVINAALEKVKKAFTQKE